MTNKLKESLRFWIQIITGVTTIAFFVVVILQLNFAKNQFSDYCIERRIDKMEILFKEFNSEDMISARVEACKNYPKGSRGLLNVMTFFERLSKFHESGIVDTHENWFYFRYPLLLYWSGWESWVKSSRRHAGEDEEYGELWKGTQNLFEAFKEKKKEKRMTQPEINNFLKFEKMLIKEAE